MSNCRNCGKPLVINGGKCAYCGASVQKSVDAPPKGPKSTPWYKKFGFSGKAKTDTWLGRLLKKILIATIIALVLAVVALLVQPWPGGLISAELLLFVIVMGICSILLTQPDIQEDLVEEIGESKAYTMLNFAVNLVLVWGYFFCIVGTVFWIFDYEWWVVLIAEIIGAIGLVVIPIVGAMAISEYT